MQRSAGLMPYFERDGLVSVFLVHPGGPFYRSKDSGVWSIAKGEHGEHEEPLVAAQREFMEEVGVPAPVGRLLDLGEVKLRGKHVRAFAVACAGDLAFLRSNDFSMEWPPHSGAFCSFPEVDRGDWFSLEEAREKMTRSQLPFLDRLVRALDVVGRLGTG